MPERVRTALVNDSVYVSAVDLIALCMESKNVKLAAYLADLIRLEKGD